MSLLILHSICTPTGVCVPMCKQHIHVSALQILICLKTGVLNFCRIIDVYLYNKEISKLYVQLNKSSMNNNQTNHFFSFFGNFSIINLPQPYLLHTIRIFFYFENGDSFRCEVQDNKKDTNWILIMRQDNYSGDKNRTLEFLP